jgi:ankyrin repeat protein
MTPLHLAAWRGNKDVTTVLVEAGASLSSVDKYVIKPSVKLKTTQLYITKVF